MSWSKSLFFLFQFKRGRPCFFGRLFFVTLEPPYKTKACKGCPVRELCTTAKNGRILARNIYTPVYEQNKRNMEADPQLYRCRQAIVEHPFGTMKRSRSLGRVLITSFPRKERNGSLQMLALSSLFIISDVY
jgi:hypothetical protein